MPTYQQEPCIDLGAKKQSRVPEQVSFLLIARSLATFLLEHLQRRRKRDFVVCNRLRMRGSEMHLHHAPMGRLIVSGTSAATQTQRKYAARLRLHGRCAVTPSVRSLVPLARLAVTLARAGAN
jgi:hypothetical protein